ncbi:MAG: hypothetical protein ACYDFS_11855 [Vulcanimicrobiaceae bacterium]
MVVPKGLAGQLEYRAQFFETTDSEERAESGINAFDVTKAVCSATTILAG